MSSQVSYVTSSNSCSASTGTTHWNGWWIEGFDSTSQSSWKLQYAHYPTAFPTYKFVKASFDSASVSSGDSLVAIVPEIRTIEYAPLDEMREVEPRRFDEFLERLRTDPEYRRQQLEAQDRLFLSQKMLGLWTIDGFNLLHRIIEHYRDAYSPTQLREIIMHAYPEMCRQGGSMATQFMGVSVRWEELTSLYEIFNRYPDDLITEVYEKRKEMLTANESFITRAETENKIPPLTMEQLKAISANAEHLLRETLTPDEYDGLIKDGHVRIRSQNDPDIVYLVKRAANERIEVYQKDKLREKLCIYFREKLPDDDIVLSKIMMLKHDEQAVLQIANHFSMGH